jgi:hypothetical protein
MTNVSLRVNTVPSEWIHRHRPLTSQSYPRVVALEADGRHIDGRFDLSATPRLDVYSVPGFVAATALNFFERHIAGHDVEHPSHPERTGIRTEGSLAVRYNSAMLAMDMLDVEYINTADAGVKADQQAASYVFTGRNLGAGVHGAVTRIATNERVQDVVGLGENVPACMLITADNGNMAVMPYELLLHKLGLPGMPYELRAPAQSV